MYMLYLFKMFKLFVMLVLVSCINARIVPSLGDTSPGSVWPQPQSHISSSQTYNVAIKKFAFTYTSKSQTCSLLTEAFKRYESIIMNGVSKEKQFSPKAPFTITTLQIDLLNPCEEYPSLQMNENYSIAVSEVPVLTSPSVWGVLRGLETFSQLLWRYNGETIINKTSISDYPRFSHRGILLDTSRHYLPVSVILQNLDAMAYNKFNVFHWHIVDEQSFPYVSQVYPDLSDKGAYTPTSHIYTPTDVAEVIEYARLRGIRVLPEFDTPGHTQSWGKGQPDLLTPCYSDGKPDGTYGPINPIVDSTYSFLSKLFAELRSVFKDAYMHLGGDEVSFACWKSNPEITEFMKEQNITGKYSVLEQDYIQKVVNITGQAGFSYVVWQEVIDNGVMVKSDTVVEVWKRKPSPEDELARVTGLGYRVLISTPWYLNRISFGEDWYPYYLYEPTNFNGTAQQKELLIGGEACMWGEWVDATNLLPRLWPRASAVAERLWSAESVNDTTKATPRLHQHRCTLVQRGIPAEPIHIGYCVYDWMN